MSHAKHLDNASSIFFLLGFAAYQFRFIPNLLITALSDILSLFFYFIAYGLWLAASHLYPDHPGLAKQWYGFAPFKTQHRISALVGTIAILCCIATLFIPIAALPACWLFLISNGIWLISEYHKKQNPIPFEKDYSTVRQEVYIRYTLAITVSSLVTAVATTLIIVFPPAAIAILIVASILELSLGALSFQYWLDYTFTDYKPDPPEESYKRMLANNLITRGKKEATIPVEIEMTTFPPPFKSKPANSRTLPPCNDECDSEDSLLRMG